MNEDFEPKITTIQINIRNGIDGLIITAKANEKIENYFKRISQGVVEEVDLRVTGRAWILKDDPAAYLKVYRTGHENALNGVIAIPNGIIRGYRLDVPGKRIIDYDQATGQAIINISFLRLEGLSTVGATFGVKGLHSPIQTRLVYDGILAAVDNFVSTFLAPINLTINLVES